MTALIEKVRPVRLEDFIAVAKGGKEVQAEIELSKQRIKYKAHPDETEERKDEVDGYLLTADYTFKVEEETWRVSKVYIRGFADESLDTARLNKNIANERLKAADLKLEPKYF
jgi:hypothetical protein